MKQFQIAFVDSRKCGSFLYFKSEETDIKKLADAACEKAQEYLQSIEKRQAFRFSFQPAEKPIKTASVAEYVSPADKKDGGPKRGGIKFKITLSVVTIKLLSGQTYGVKAYVLKP